MSVDPLITSMRSCTVDKCPREMDGAMGGSVCYPVVNTTYLQCGCKVKTLYTHAQKCCPGNKTGLAFAILFVFRTQAYSFPGWIVPRRLSCCRPPSFCTTEPPGFQTFPPIFPGPGSLLLPYPICSPYQKKSSQKTGKYMNER